MRLPDRCVGRSLARPGALHLIERLHHRELQLIERVIKAALAMLEVEVDAHACDEDLRYGGRSARDHPVVRSELDRLLRRMEGELDRQLARPGAELVAVGEPNTMRISAILPESAL